MGIDVSDVENYQVWNMGIFITLIAPKRNEDRLFEICAKHKVTPFRLGYVEQGARQVIIKPKKILYTE